MTVHYPLPLFILTLVVCSSFANEERPETLFRRTVAAWHFSQSYQPFESFGQQLLKRFSTSSHNRLELVGAMEEGILIIEKAIFEQGQGSNEKRDKALSQLYTVYATALSELTPRECLDLCLDPHTLLIGAETHKNQPSTEICLENADNSARNAASLDATNRQAEELIQKLNGGSVHERKPKEFVAELFDSFADTFDRKLLENLEYKVPALVGNLTRDLRKHMSTEKYEAALDAGCGTGLAGRYLRPFVRKLIGVDASQKMLDIARDCTLTAGCGLEKSNENDEPLYDGLLQMDLEEMTVENTLQKVFREGKGFDLIVAADVLVYFGSLEKLLTTFASISTPGAVLVFSCERAAESEAPLGWRLLPSGRFAHTKRHAVDMAARVGYGLEYYQEIVPRMEKGEPVQGHLFGFVSKRGKNDEL